MDRPPSLVSGPTRTTSGTSNSRQQSLVCVEGKPFRRQATNSPALRAASMGRSQVLGPEGDTRAREHQRPMKRPGKTRPREGGQEPHSASVTRCQDTQAPQKGRGLCAGTRGLKSATHSRLQGTLKVSVESLSAPQQSCGGLHRGRPQV